VTALLMAGVGCGCLWHALVNVRRKPGRHEPGVLFRMRGIVVVVARLSRPASRVAWLRREDRDAAVDAAFALIPDAWPCRLASIDVTPGQAKPSLDETHVAGLRLASGIAVLVVAVCALLVAGPAPGIVVGILLPLGLVLPDAVMARRVRAARRRLTVSLPDALDLIAAALRAGHDLDGAIALASTHSAPPLGRVLTDVSARVAIGQSIVAALQEVAGRTGEPTIASVAALIARHRALGIPVAPSLNTVADEARSRAHIAIAERAARAGPLAAILTAGVIAPACVVFLVVVVLGGLTERGAILGL
jgi:Flp pilus assembly protein TadB